MILRTAGPGPAFHPQPSAKPSRGAVAAIVVSLLLHAVVGLYLYAHRFALTSPPHPPDEPVITIKTVRFPPPPPPPPTHEKRRQPPRQRAQEPIHIHQAPAILGLNPGPTIEVGSGPSGNGGGQGLSQVIPQPPPAPPRPKVKTILNPDWISKPSGVQLAGAYPDRALDLGRPGSATLLCTVAVNGQVRDCTVLEETPRDFGFGAAALKLSQYFRIRPETEDGEAVDGALVRVPITFGVK
jgi:protein TonB